MNFNIQDLIFYIPIIIMIAVIIKLLVSMHENKKYWNDENNMLGNKYPGSENEDLNIPNNINEELDNKDNVGYDERVEELMKKFQEDPNFDIETAMLENLYKDKLNETEIKNP